MTTRANLGNKLPVNLTLRHQPHVSGNGTRSRFCPLTRVYKLALSAPPVSKYPLS